MLRKKLYTAFLLTLLSPVVFGQIEASLQEIKEPVDLTKEGSTDWINWGWAHRTRLVNRKANVVPQLNDYQVVGTQRIIGFRNSPLPMRWSDGTPVTTGEGMTHGVFTAGKDQGFSLTVNTQPAGQTLKLYVGTFASYGKIEAFFSDGSAKAVELQTPAGNKTYVVTVKFKSDRPGTKLLVRWTDGEDDNFGNITLQAATLAGTAPKRVAATVQLSSPEAGKTSVAHAASVPLKASVAGGKVASVAFFDGETWLGEMTREPFGLVAERLSPGQHAFRAVATLANGAQTPLSAPLVITIPPANAGEGKGGYLTGNFSEQPTEPVDLTAEGSVDWSLWGEVYQNFIWHRKADGPGLISNLTKLGEEKGHTNVHNTLHFNWSNGYPLAQTRQAAGGMWTTGTDNGYEFRVAADTTLRTLKVYVAVWHGQGKLSAGLSDGSARDYTDISLSSPEDAKNGVYTLRYKAAKPGEFLRVRYTTHDKVLYGNANVYAAALSQ